METVECIMMPPDASARVRRMRPPCGKMRFWQNELNNSPPLPAANPPETDDLASRPPPTIHSPTRRTPSPTPPENDRLGLWKSQKRTSPIPFHPPQSHRQRVFRQNERYKTAVSHPRPALLSKFAQPLLEFPESRTLLLKRSSTWGRRYHVPRQKQGVGRPLGGVERAPLPQCAVSLTL